VAGTCGYSEGLSGFINAGNFLTSLLVSFSRRTLLHGVSKYLLILLACAECDDS
jgi:hypothetical protein